MVAVGTASVVVVVLAAYAKAVAFVARTTFVAAVGLLAEQSVGTVVALHRHFGVGLASTSDHVVGLAHSSLLAFRIVRQAQAGSCSAAQFDFQPVRILGHGFGLAAAQHA